jgi:hypothetical protein
MAYGSLESGCMSRKRRIHTESVTTASTRPCVDLFSTSIRPSLDTLLTSISQDHGCTYLRQDMHLLECKCSCHWAFDDPQDGICFNDCKGCTCGFPCRRLNWDKAWVEYKLLCKRNEILLFQMSGNHGLLILSGEGLSSLADPDSIRLYA